jgi:hypothetical protein
LGILTANIGPAAEAVDTGKMKGNVARIGADGGSAARFAFTDGGVE